MQQLIILIVALALAGALIRSDDIDIGKVTKTVLVQNMDANEFSLVEALMERNDELRVIAVGDDDQNIYQFRGSDSKYLRKLITDYNAKQYDLVENYRSSRSIVNFANCFVKEITERLKTADISAVTSQNGEVRFVKHTGSYIENALIDDVISTYDGGTTCVLTNTNDETLVVLGILKQRGVEAMAVDDDYLRNNPSNNVLKELKQSHCFQTEKRRALQRCR